MVVTPYKGRGVYPGDLVDVYRNINSDTWSIRAVSGPHKNKVIAHADSITMYDCAFRVSEAGRQRVLKEKRKNVHAFVRGRYAIAASVSLHTLSGGADEARRVSYNPYRGPHFTTNANTPIALAKWVRLGEEGQVWKA